MNRIGPENIKEVERYNRKGKRELLATLNNGDKFVLIATLYVAGENPSEEAKAAAATEWLEVGRIESRINSKRRLGYSSPGEYAKDMGIETVVAQLGWVIGPAIDPKWTIEKTTIMFEERPDQFSIWMPKPPLFD